jgi:hypothetical protein
MGHLDAGLVLNGIRQFSPVFLGGAIGYAFYHFVGCKTGTCPITRNPWLSILYGAFIGALMIPR